MAWPRLQADRRSWSSWDEALGAVLRHALTPVDICVLAWPSPGM